MTTIAPIPTLFAMLQRAEPRYQRACDTEEHLMSRADIAGDSVRTRRAATVADAYAKRLGATLRILCAAPARSTNDLAVKAAVGLNREDDPAVFQSLARDVVAIAQQGFTARERAGALLTADQLRGIRLR